MSNQGASSQTQPLTEYMIGFLQFLKTKNITDEDKLKCEALIKENNQQSLIVFLNHFESVGGYSALLYAVIS